MRDVVPYEEAITRAAACVAEGRRIRDSLSVQDAAKRAHQAGGPTISELEAMIRAQRD